MKILSFIPALIMLAVIFNFSAQEGKESGNLSYRISFVVVKTADGMLDWDASSEELEEYAGGIHFWVRKIGHVSEYFLLTLFIYFPLRLYRVDGRRLVLLTAAICVLTAGLDEIHQLFVAGRDGSVRDVLIDSIGIAAAILVGGLCFYNKRSHTKLNFHTKNWKKHKVNV